MWIKKGWHILSEAIGNFFYDDCYTKAATLTFYTIQSIVPLFAALLGIAKGFGFDAYLQEVITKNFQEQKVVFSYVIEFADMLLNQISSGIIIGIGVLFLFWTTINLLGYIETSLNAIWRLITPRGIFQKTKDYLLFLFLCPLIFVVSNSLTVYVKTQLTALQYYPYPYLPEISSALLWLHHFVPWFLNCLLFFLLYILMPNTAARWLPSVVAALFSGTLFQLWQVVFINFQLLLFNYNAVYGTFAFLPLFLIWLHFTWLIALAGAELAFQIENQKFLSYPFSSGNLVAVNKKALYLLLLSRCLKNYYHGLPPLSRQQIGAAMKLPLNEIQSGLDLLVQSNILTPLPLPSGIGYSPVSDPSFHNIKSICDIIDKSNDTTVMMPSTPPLSYIMHLLKNLDGQILNSDDNISLATLANFPDD